MSLENSNSIAERFEKWRIGFEQNREVCLRELCSDQPELYESLARRAAAWRRMNQTWHTEQVDHHFKEDLDDSALTGKERIDLAVEYRELKHLATGGLGVVYEASDATLDRTVAIKTERSGAQSQDASDPFVVEARITAGLDHPGVVPVYGMGQTETGSTFYSMRMVRGVTMGEAIETFHQSHDTKLPASFVSREFHDLLARFSAACKTIAYAHSRGILHCDIKPRNILFGRFGETIVLDWGAARSVTRSAEDKTSGEGTLEGSQSDSDFSTSNISGTLPYMSPEQTAGGDNLTKQSDVFSLGVTLYSLLTGQTPYTGSSTHEIRQQIIRAEFPKPRGLIKKISPAIEAICLKAMAHAPVDRYRSAMDLAEDVERFVADETIPGFREPIPRRLARQIRRHRHAALVATISLISIALLTFAFMFWQTRSAQRERQARYQGLVARAALAADSIRYELDRRIWSLEEAATNPKVRQFLQQWPQDPKSEGVDFLLCRLLDTIAEPYAGQLDSYCWFVNANDGLGTQIARHPVMNKKGEQFSSLGKSYARREYFHGQVKLPENIVVDQISPIRSPHVSAPFRGTHGEIVVAISVPVFADAKKEMPLGVIGMAVRLGDITVVDRAVHSGDLLVIGNLSEDFIEKDSIEPGQGKWGLIMQHPVFQNQSVNENQSDSGAKSEFVPRLDPSTLDSIGKVAKDRDSQGGLLSVKYKDPVGRVFPVYKGNWLASHAIVNRPSRLPTSENLGWVIILQERH